MEVPPELLQRAADWEGLKRWERRELGQELRKLGLSHGEIRQILPVPKGTLSEWCRDIPLTPEQLERIKANGGNGAVGRAKAGAVLRKRRLDQVAAIRAAGRAEAGGLSTDPEWTKGVVAYWAEGAKRDNEMKFSNSDPGLVNLFIEWAQDYLDLCLDRFTMLVHFHAGQDEMELRKYWSSVTGVPLSAFRKGFMKAEGSGHRKNVLYNGTAAVRVTRSTDLLHRVKGWIDHVAGGYKELG